MMRRVASGFPCAVINLGYQNWLRNQSNIAAQGKNQLPRIRGMYKDLPADRFAFPFLQTVRELFDLRKEDTAELDSMILQNRAIARTGVPVTINRPLICVNTGVGESGKTTALYLSCYHFVQQGPD